MIERDDDWIVLAGEYVLGTLSAADMAAFERQLQKDPKLQDEVDAWEQRLTSLNEDTPPVAPSMSVWRGIEQRINDEANQAKPGFWYSLALWRSLTAAAVIALVAVIVIPQQPALAPAEEALPVYSLIMQAEAESPEWLMVCDWRDREMTITRVSAPAQADKDYELWLIPHSGDGPISMGIMRGKSQVAAIPANINWKDTKAFAVSLEPRGGSPSGAPTGPVLYAAQPPTKKV